MIILATAAGRWVSAWRRGLRKSLARDGVVEGREVLKLRGRVEQSTNSIRGSHVRRYLRYG